MDGHGDLNPHPSAERPPGRETPDRAPTGGSDADRPRDGRFPWPQQGPLPVLAPSSAGPLPRGRVRRGLNAGAAPWQRSGAAGEGGAIRGDGMKTETHQSMPRGLVPNSRFPLLVHRGAVPGGGEDAVRGMFQRHGWLNNWRYPGIYRYGHFHSTTHECLGCASGWMEIEIFGKGGETGEDGSAGPLVRLEAGDVVVMPAGVSHAMTGNSDDNLMIGGYPDGRDWDNVVDTDLTPELRDRVAKRIMTLPIPDKDPVTGEPMREWLEAPSSVDGGWNEFRDGLGAA